MSFSLGSWITTVIADAKAAEQRVLSIFGEVVHAIDVAAPVAETVLTAVDPSVVPAVAAGVAVIDEVHAAVMAAAPGQPVTVTITPATVQGILQAGKDAKAWLASVGVKL